MEKTSIGKGFISSELRSGIHAGNVFENPSVPLKSKISLGSYMMGPCQPPRDPPQGFQTMRKYGHNLEMAPGECTVARGVK